MTISPEALEKARAIAQSICDNTRTLIGENDIILIAAALQAERDAAAPKLPDDVAGLVERLRDFGCAYPLDVFPEVTDGERGWLRTEHPGLQDRIAASMGRHFAEHAAEAASTLQSLVARIAELEAGLVETTEWLDDATPPYVWGSGSHIAWEAEQKRRVTAARSLLNKDRQP